MHVYINGIGLIAPGLEGFNASQPILLGETDWQSLPLIKQVVEILPPNERRRTTSVIKLALNVGKSAVVDAGIETESLTSVFSSSDGDLEIVDKLCLALCEKEKFFSPTLFHNSVHNAPAGYWAIASNSNSPSTSISAADASFAAGLLESVTQVTTNHSDVLFVSYDYPPVAPLDKKRDITIPFGLALVLSASHSDTSRASLHINTNTCFNNMEKPTKCQNSTLETLRFTNPTARCLPLLESISRKQSRDIVLPYNVSDSLTLRIEP